MNFKKQISSIVHKQWAHWQKYFMAKYHSLDYVASEYTVFEVHKEDIDRWKKQIETPYSALSPREQKSDDEWADKYLEAMDKYMEEKIKEAIKDYCIYADGHHDVYSWDEESFHKFWEANKHKYLNSKDKP